jgi:hypothetical protein
VASTYVFAIALILRSAAGASRRRLQLAPEPLEASFETPRSRLLRMRAEKIFVSL